MIAALDEAASLGAAIASARVDSGTDHEPSTGPAPEIEGLVDDGGRRDAVAARARAAGARVPGAGGGRARARNAGRRARRGDAVLFLLHADARPPRRPTGAVRRALGDPGVAAAALRLRFVPRPPARAAIGRRGAVRVRG